MKVPHIKLPRLAGWVLFNVFLVGLIAIMASQQLPVMVYKVSLVSIAALVAYMVDRSLFARMSDRLNKDMPRDSVSSARVIARALIFVGVVLGLSLGV